MTNHRLFDILGQREQQPIAVSACCSCPKCLLPPLCGTDVDAALMQAYLNWEYGLVSQMDDDGTTNFTVLVS